MKVRGGAGRRLVHSQQFRNLSAASVVGPGPTAMYRDVMLPLAQLILRLAWGLYVHAFTKAPVGCFWLGARLKVVGLRCHVLLSLVRYSSIFVCPC